jgi:hypothetical protein
MTTCSPGSRSVRRASLRAWPLVVLLVAAAAGAETAAQKPNTAQPGGGSVAAARKFLEGRWFNESFEVLPPGKPPIRLKGSGVLNYDDFGNLTMEVRADQASSDLLRAAGINIKDGVISTQGRTVIDLQNRTLTYFLEGQRSSYATGGGPLALNRPRHWEVNGDVLTLTTKDDLGAPLSISRWKKAK